MVFCIKMRVTDISKLLFCSYQSRRYHISEKCSIAGTCCLELSERVGVRFLQNSGLSVMKLQEVISRQTVCGAAITGKRKTVSPEMLI
jgi:hypothetical protein